MAKIGKVSHFFPIGKAKKGDDVAIKVDQKVKEGMEVEKVHN